MINKMKFYKNEILVGIVYVLSACVVNGVKYVVEIATLMFIVFSIALILDKIIYGKWCFWKRK